MKKIIFALTAAAFASATYAQSTVTLYGKIDASIQNTSTTGMPSQTKISSGALDSSRWGLKGSEDLGGGLNASFQLESGFSVDTGAVRGASNLFSRVAKIALTGGFGSVSAGLQWTPYDNAWLDALDYNGASAMNAAFYAGVHGDNGNTGWGNAKNSIQYATPDFNGFNAVVMVAPGEDAMPGMSASRYTGFGVNYAAGPLAVSFGQETLTPMGSGANTNGWILTGSYALNVVNLFAAYERGSTPTTDETGYSVGASMPLGAKMNLAASYASETTDFKAAGADDKTTAFGTTLVYNMSARTNVYGAYLRSEYTPGGGSGVTTSTFSLGVRHNF
ncbi:MAG: porin [Polaromonas sp.]|nr:porin [Polaromonas sp.]